MAVFLHPFFFSLIMISSRRSAHFARPASFSFADLFGNDPRSLVMAGILLCRLTRFMFEREQRAFLQWPFMPCEKYMSLLAQLMKLLSCPPPVEVYRDGLSRAHISPSVACSTL